MAGSRPAARPRVTTSSLIRPDQTWALWAVLLVVAALGLWGERTRLGGRLSAMVLALLGTFALANLGVIPPDAPVYDAVWTYVVPIAVPLLLFRADLRRILREAGPTLLAFAAGAVGTVAGTFIAAHLVNMGPATWQLAAVFCATYIGGSMNFVAVAQAVDLRSSDLLAAGVAADNLVMAAYFLVLFSLPSVGWLRRLFTRRHESTPEPAPGEVVTQRPGPGLLALATALAVSASLCAVGYALESVVGVKGTAILIITLLVVAAATLMPRRMQLLEGADLVGTYLMHIFFAAIGASAHIGTVLRVGPKLFLFTTVILAVHLAIILVAGRLLKLDLAEVVIASNANVGGPTTAAAMATARRWDQLVIPAILCGTLGYAIANFIGIAVGYALR